MPRARLALALPLLLGMLRAASAPAVPVTYSGEVRAILDRRCVSCHRPGEIAPMSFTSYSEVRPWAKAIKEAVLKRAMPPWSADPSVGLHFLNDRSLTAAEIRTLATWVDDGAKEGLATAAETAPPSENTGWRLGKPDLVIRIPGYQVPSRAILQYTFLVTPLNLPNDTWIAAAEWKIEHRAVVHHINAFIRPRGSSYVAEAPVGQFYIASAEERAARRPGEAETDRRELLVGYEPGYIPQPWGAARAKLLRKDSDIVFEMHYTPNGKPVTDYSELGLYFARTAPRQRVLTIAPADANLAIPPGDADYVSTASAKFTTPVTLVSLQPHMHLRGKAYRFEAVYPDGRRQILLDVPHYDFNWQTTYFPSAPFVIPPGAAIVCTAHYDNSPNNPLNPDPAKTVHWGDQSFEEMNIGFFEVAFDATRDPNVAVLSGTTKPAPSSLLPK